MVVKKKRQRAQQPRRSRPEFWASDTTTPPAQHESLLTRLPVRQLCPVCFSFTSTLHGRSVFNPLTFPARFQSCTDFRLNRSIQPVRFRPPAHVGHCCSPSLLLPSSGQQLQLPFRSTHLQSPQNPPVLPLRLFALTAHFSTNKVERK